MKPLLARLALLPVLCGCFRAPRYEPGEQVHLMADRAPVFQPSNDPQALARFAVGAWKNEGLLRPMPGSMREDMDTYGPFLWLKEDGTAEYRVAIDYSEGRWWSDGRIITTQFDRHHLPELRTDPPGEGDRDAGYRLHLMALKSLEHLRVSDDGRGLKLDLDSVHNKSEWRRFELKKN